MIACETLTLWRRVAADGDHALWERSTLSGARCEPLRGSRASQPGPTPSDGLSAYVYGDADVAPRDMVAPGERWDAEPPADALQVTDVRRYSLGARAHHVEVEAR